MTASVLTAANWPIVGQICWVLGKVMAGIYNILDSVLPGDAGLVGLSIIVYTILVYTLMLPMTIQQQKTSRITAVIQPEIQAVQKKYRNKKDQASMLAQQEEMQQVYDKYGTSMMGGCLPMLIQMPFLFALYPVIYSISDYVPAIKTAPEAVNRFLTIPDLTKAPSWMLHNRANLGLPVGAVIATVILLPILSGATQYLSIILSQKVMGTGANNDKDNPMAQSMQTMNVTMPLFSVFMVYTLPTGIGIYWIVSAVVRTVQMFFINKYLKNLSLEDIVEANKEKAKKKAEKRGEKAERVAQMATQNTKSLSKSANRGSSASLKEREAKVEAARRNAKPGSLASKANMVRDFNDHKK